MKRFQRKTGIERLKARYGCQFVAHWVVGLVLFFVIPVVNSLRYSFSEMSVTSEGIHMAFAGIVHYKDMLMSNGLYINNLVAALADMFTSLPIIMALSLILAVVLNQRFRGRLAARAIFFLPVIIASGVVINILKSGYIHAPLFNVTSGAEYEYGGLIDFNEILSNLQLPEQVTALFSKYLSNVFDLIWSCGIQLVLFLSGLQSIPAQLYEVSKIEGATKWEEFWYLTVPMPVPDGVDYNKPYLSMSETQAYAVAKNAANPEAAPYFVRYFMDSANYDMDSFFVDDQAKEVYEWTRKQTNIANMTMDVLVDKAQYGNSVHDMSYALRRTEQGQIKTTLDTYKAMIEKCAADKNAELKKLG